MNNYLENIIRVRKRITNYSEESFGFQGEINDVSEEDIINLRLIPQDILIEIYNKEDSNDLRAESLKVGENIRLAIDLSSNDNYYERFNQFTERNPSNFPEGDFYIHELKYYTSSNNSSPNLESFRYSLEIFHFLKSISSMVFENQENTELVFINANKVYKSRHYWGDVNFDSIVIKNQVDEFLIELNNEVGSKNKKRVFINELINFLKKKGSSTEVIFKYWDEIIANYKKSYEIFIADISYEEIKISSQRDFLELTDRIHEVISKFSTYILAIPLAYIFIIRFFDFGGENLPKDIFLLIIGIFYFVIIWWVMLQNISSAFKTIENDVSRFHEKIKKESSLGEISALLSTQIEETIPSQKRKIVIVKVISVIILLLICSAFIYIHFGKIEHFVLIKYLNCKILF